MDLATEEVSYKASPNLSVPFIPMVLHVISFVDTVIVTLDHGKALPKRSLLVIIVVGAFQGYRDVTRSRTF